MANNCNVIFHLLVLKILSGSQVQICSKRMQRHYEEKNNKYRFRKLPTITKSPHQQEHRLLPDFLLVPSRKAVQVAQVHKSNVGLLFNINFNNINLFD